MAGKQTDHNSEQETLGTKLSRADAVDNQTIPTADQNAIRAYLLGQLTRDRQQQVEERLLAEDEFFEEMEIAEDELMDEFLAGELTETERAGFEQYFSRNPERQQNLRFAQVLNRNLKVIPTPLPLPWWRRSPNDPVPWWSSQNVLLRVAAAVAVVAVVSPVLWFTLIRPTPAPTFAALTLTISNGNRSTGANAAKAKNGVDELRIVLLLPERSTAARYRAELMTEKGETRTLKLAEPDAQSVSVVIPARDLPRGQYAIKLFALNADGTERRINGSYLFTIE